MAVYGVLTVIHQGGDEGTGTVGKYMKTILTDRRCWEPFSYQNLEDTAGGKAVGIATPWCLTSGVVGDFTGQPFMGNHPLTQ